MVTLSRPNHGLLHQYRWETRKKEECHKNLTFINMRWPSQLGHLFLFCLRRLVVHHSWPIWILYLSQFSFRIHSIVPSEFPVEVRKIWLRQDCPSIKLLQHMVAIFHWVPLKMLPDWWHQFLTASFCHEQAYFAIFLMILSKFWHDSRFERRTFLLSQGVNHLARRELKYFSWKVLIASLQFALCVPCPIRVTAKGNGRLQ